MRQLEDVSKPPASTMRNSDNSDGLPYPLLREKGAKGFRRIAWDDALARIANRLRHTDPERFAFFVTSRGVTNEVYYMAQKGGAFSRHEQRGRRRASVIRRARRR